MRAIIQTIPGDPWSLVVNEDVPLPQPGYRGLLIRIQYTALNRMDLLQARGNYPVPVGASNVLGVEVSGTIAAIGDDCQCGFKYGESVMALLLGGGYAEFCCADERHVVRAFTGISMQVLASVPEAFMTAYQLCFMVGNIQSGESVILHAAASSVGQAAIQMLARKGVKVYATVRTEAKRLHCLRLGATAAFLIDSSNVNFAQSIIEANNNSPVHVVLDPVGASYVQENLNSLSIDGRWVLYGLMSGAAIPSEEPALLARLLAKRILLLPSTLRSRSAEYKEEILSRLEEDPVGFPAIRSGDITVVVDKVFAMEEVLAAHRYMNQNENTGKILMAVTSTSNALEFFEKELDIIARRNHIKK